jgi:Na+/H+ antiporter NhaC
MAALLIFSPILLCIIIALSTKKIFWALGAGIFSATGILLWNDQYSDLTNVGIELFTIEKLILLTFTVLLIFNTQLLIENGSLNGLMSQLTRKVKTRKQALFVTYISGLIIFFDDYANTLVIGNSFKPIADKYRISREKLAFLVDSTAAPVACIAIISTWVGFELSQIDQGPAPVLLNSNSYEIFIQSIPYALYPLLMLVFIPASIFWGRDFGPMLHAERDAQQNETKTELETQADPSTAFISIAILLFGTMGYLLAHAAIAETKISIQTIFSEGDPFMAMLFSSSISVLFTILKSKKNQIHVSVSKAKNILLEPVGILLAAWTLGLLIAALNPAHQLHDFLKGVPLSYIPLGVFILGAILSFATGSSFGTMSILFPIVIPFLQEELSGVSISDLALEPLILGTIASVLSGAIFGDHCSPISDTTILSSTATECNHLSHFRTQAPYALTIGILASLGLYLFGWLNLPIWIILILMTSLTFAIPRILGQKILKK